MIIQALMEGHQKIVFINLRKKRNYPIITKIIKILCFMNIKLNPNLLTSQTLTDITKISLNLKSMGKIKMSLYYL